MDETLANSFADFVRAAAALKPSDREARLKIAALLGLRWVDKETAEPEVRPAARRSAAAGAAAAAAAAPEPFPHAEAPQRRRVPARLHAVEGEAGEPPDWVRRVKLLEEPAAADTPPPFVPLFRRRWTRHILSGALATVSTGEGRLEIEPVIAAVARAEPLLTLPRRPRPTLARGIQLLVDRGAALEPFYGDQAQLQAEMVKVVGRERTEVLSFAGCPLWGAGVGLRDEWGDYRPPPRGTPVVLLTDLGIGRPPVTAERAGVKDWLAFNARLRKAGCLAVAFVPYAPARWPPRLWRAMPILHWDHTTTAATVKSVVGLGLKIENEG